MYLPGVAAASCAPSRRCPPELAPIAELQYRSQWFSHPNSRDWTVRALLTHRERGLGLQRRRRRRHQHGAAARARPAARRAGRPAREAGARRRLTSTSSSTRIRSAASSVARRPAGLPHAARRRAVDGVRAAVQGGLRLRPDDRRRDHRRPEARRARRAAGRRSGSGSPRRPSGTPGSPTSSARPRPDELIVETRRRLAAGQRDGRGPAPQSAARLRGAHRRGRPQGGRTRSTPSTRWRRGTVWADLDQAPLAFALEQLVLARRADRHSRSACGDLASLVGRLRRARLAGRRRRRCGRSPPHAAPADRGACPPRSQRCTGRGSTPAPRRCRRRSARWRTTGTYAPGPPASTAPGVVTCSSTACASMSRTGCRTASPAPVSTSTSTTSLAALPTVTQTAKPALVPVADGCARRRAGSASSQRRRRARRHRSRCCGAHGRRTACRCSGPPRPATRRDGVDRGRRDRPPRPRRRRPARRLPRRRGRPHRRPHPRAARRRLDSGSTSSPTTAGCCCPGGMEKVELPAATTEVKKGRCARLKDGAAVDVADRPVVLGPGRADRARPGRHLLRGEQGVRARRREPAGVHRARGSR